MWGRRYAPTVINSRINETYETSVIFHCHFHWHWYWWYWHWYWRCIDLQILYAKIRRCICPNWKMFLPKLENVFVQMEEKKIFTNYQMHILHICTGILDGTRMSSTLAKCIFPNCKKDFSQIVKCICSNWKFIFLHYKPHILHIGMAWLWAARL